MTASPRRPGACAAPARLPAFADGLLARTAAIRRSRPADPWLVGFSHGADSTALLTGLAELAEARPLPPILAVHVDHGLREESAAEARRARAFTAALGLPCLVLRLDLPAGTREGRARAARYAAFRTVAAERGASLLLLAHHARDQAETRLHRLLRGTGPLGLAGMPASRPLCPTPRGPCRVLRPLLAEDPDDLRAWLAARDLAWIEDPTNADPDHGPRNAIRHRLAPRITADPRARRALDDLGREAARLRGLVLGELAALCAPARDGASATWPLAALAGLSPWAFERWLGLEVEARGHPRPSRALGRGARALLAPGTPSGKRVESRGRWRLVRERSVLRLAPDTVYKGRMDARRSELGANLDAVLADVAATFAASGRGDAAPALIAVTKYSTVLETRALAESMHERGLPLLLGESRVQGLLAKRGELFDPALPIRWQLIGTLQRNKAGQALEAASRIHSIDRLEILDRLEKLADERDRRWHGLLQVHLSGEESKHGFAPEELEEAIERARACPRLVLEGLMTMAPRGTDHDSARPTFATLRGLRDRLAPELRELSMGMSGDYRGAILEGATLLRIGSALFAGAEHQT
ncbi:MAG: tRNA lysidine(34) synthetase TilS [Planctomycetota bacterium]